MCVCVCVCANSTGYIILGVALYIECIECILACINNLQMVHFAKKFRISSMPFLSLHTHTHTHTHTHSQAYIFIYIRYRLHNFRCCIIHRMYACMY